MSLISLLFKFILKSRSFLYNPFMFAFADLICIHTENYLFSRRHNSSAPVQWNLTSNRIPPLGPCRLRPLPRCRRHPRTKR